MILYIVLVWLHIVAACVWLGSSVFLAVGVLPFFRGRAAPLFIEFIEWSAPRLRVVGWGSLCVLTLTGCAVLWARGIEVATVLDTGFWSNPFGRTLGEKLALVCIMVALTAFHDVYWGPRSLTLRRLDADSAAARRARAMTRVLGQASLVLSLAAVLLGVMLVRGRP